MEEIALDVQIRTELGKQGVKRIRNNDLIPAVVYGGKKKAPTVIEVPRRTYEGIQRHHSGGNVVFHINVFEGDKKLRDYSAIVKDEQHEPVSYDLIHLDFQRISLSEEIEVKVQIEVKGEAVGVKQDDGSVDQAMWEMDVVCLPTNIPEKIEVDISNLEINDSIHVGDIKLPEGVKTKHDPESTIVSVVPPQEEEPEAAEAEEPEVIGEKKEGEESSEEEASAEEEKKEESSEETKE